VLIVVADAANLNAGDLELEEILDDLEIDSDFANDEDDANDAIDDPDDFQGVFISGSVDPNVLGDEYINEDLPILIMDDQTFNEMELADDNDGADFGQELESELEIEDDGHPLAGGLDSNDDEIEVTNNQENLNFIEAEGDGEEIASLANGGDTAIAVWEKDDEALDDREVQDRRIAYWATDAFIDDLRADGELLLESAIIYTLTGSDSID
jgi:hypothetical protein